MCNEQPLSLTALPIYATSPLFELPGDGPEHLPGHTNAEGPRDRQQITTPLDIENPLTPDRRPQPRTRRTSFGRTKRPSISAPYAFRRLGHDDGQRQSLVPLRLGPVVLRDSPLPRDSECGQRTSQLDRLKHKRSDSTIELPHEPEMPELSTRQQRRTPFERCNASGTSLDTAPLVAEVPSAAQPGRVRHVSNPARPSLWKKSSLESVQRQPTPPKSLVLLPSELSRDRIRPRHKRSWPTMRRPYSESGDEDLDHEILELKTIVEERRAETNRRNTSDQHIPAVAPQMQIRARSETLDAIGSAFFQPLGEKSSRQSISTSKIPVLPETRSQRSGSTSTSWTSSRVPVWLSGMFTSPPHTRQQSAEPFYQCKQPPSTAPRPRSVASVSSFDTDIEEPALTVGSSPTSKGHSRSQTNESWTMTHPPTPIYNNTYPAADVSPGRKKLERGWSQDAWSPTGEVGVAF